MNTNHAIVPFAAFCIGVGCLGQEDLNSLRQREWVQRLPEVGAELRIDDLGATTDVVLSVRTQRTKLRTLLSMRLPIDRLGGVVLVPYQPVMRSAARKFELLVSGVANEFDGGQLPVVTGRYCRVIVDYTPGLASPFQASVTETVDLPDVDPIAIGWAGFGNDDPDRVVLHDSRNRRLLFGAGGLSAGLLPRSGYAEELAQFPLDWLRRGSLDTLDPLHPDGALRVAHQADPSRYVKVGWDQSTGWAAQLVDRPEPASGPIDRFRKRFPGAGFSPNSLPEVFVPGSLGQTATIRLHDASGAPIGSHMTVARGQWASLPAQPALDQFVGRPVRMRVNGQTQTQVTMTPTARFGAPWSSRTGFELSPCTTSARYCPGAKSPHGFHVLRSVQGPDEKARFFATYALWDPTTGPAPVAQTGVPGVDMLVPAALVQFEKLELERINGGLGLDVGAPPEVLQGLVLLCQYAIAFEDGTLAVSDVCGTRILKDGASPAVVGVPPAVLAAAADRLLAAQVARVPGGVKMLGDEAVAAAADLQSMIQ